MREHFIPLNKSEIGCRNKKYTYLDYGIIMSCICLLQKQILPFCKVTDEAFRCIFF